MWITSHPSVTYTVHTQGSLNLGYAPEARRAPSKGTLRDSNVRPLSALVPLVESAVFTGRKRGQSSASASSSPEDEDEVVPFADARPSRRDIHEDDEDDDSDEGDAADDDTFIVEDDNAVAPELPAEFSMNTYQDLLHHFKIICQLFVHISVHPLEDRETVVNQFSKSTCLTFANVMSSLSSHRQTNTSLFRSRSLGESSSA